MSSICFWQIVLQKSPSGLCEIEICNYRIGAPVLLNRCCSFQPDLESIFLAEMLKILLQHYRAPSRPRGTSALISAFGGKSGNLMFAPSFSGYDAKWNSARLASLLVARGIFSRRSRCYGRALPPIRSVTTTARRRFSPSQSRLPGRLGSSDSLAVPDRRAGRGHRSRARQR
jgi:hypothetical protein